ncbi:hypothetical protein HMPREF1544_06247 [Mucor circinelloides 1006PhL]|uniref:Zn(2)-C6 fungal-type domain-containing protein n=1 Tax=Mucor circinelloides f. circinelloides (strain 1006PhL) TaxID=1220926 RepID=S2JB56_MUCC1|nr:hypothetical protein HMPREF1544_06247 [Mucor circinelloides 1006PhL]
MNQNTKSMVDGDKTRRKRLKVVSACGECRRKKTKCNGEQPCAGCLKAHVECKYVNSQKSSASATNTTASTAAAAAIVNAPVPTTKAAGTVKSQKMIHSPSIETTHEHTMLNSAPPLTPATSTAPSSSASPSTLPSNTTATFIESIEERLGTIENILRALLGSGKNKHLLQSFHPQQQQQQQRSESSVYMDPKPHYYSHHPHHHSDASSSNTSTSSSSCGDMYSSPHLVHAPHIQNRPIPREKRQRHEEEEEGMTETKRLNVRDDFGHGYHHHQQQHQHQHQHHPYAKLQLAPIKIINHTPGTPTTSIRNLLNDQTEEDQHQKKKPRWYPTSSSSTTTTTTTSTTNSAFYRMSSPRNEMINSNSATTAAGNFT